MAAFGDESEAFKNSQQKLQSDVQGAHQSSKQIVHELVTDYFDKNSVEQGLLQGAKTSITTTCPLGSSSELPSFSLLPPGLSAAPRGRGRGRGSRSSETVAVNDGASWRSRPPPPASNYRGPPRERGRGGGPSTRGGYAGSPTTSHFQSGRRGGRHGSYKSGIVPYLNQNQASIASRNTPDDGDDTPPPGFYSSDNDKCPPPVFNSSDTSADDGPPPGFEEEEDAPPPGFENNNNDNGGGARGGGGWGDGRYGGQSSNFDIVANTREQGGRGGISTGNTRIQPPQTGRGVKVLQVPRNRPTSASSSYANSLGSSQLNYILSSSAAAAASGREMGGNTSGVAATKHFPPLKREVQQPVFNEFSPSSQFTSFVPNYIDGASSALRQIAIGGAPTKTISADGGVGAATGVPTPEQPAPLIPPMHSTLQITPLYPQIGIKSIW